MSSTVNALPLSLCHVTCPDDPPPPPRPPPSDCLRSGWSMDQILRAARQSILEDPSPANAMFRLQRQHVHKVARRLGIPPERLRTPQNVAEGHLPALRSLAERYAETGEVRLWTGYPRHSLCDDSRFIAWVYRSIDRIYRIPLH